MLNLRDDETIYRLYVVAQEKSNNATLTVSGGVTGL